MVRRLWIAVSLAILVGVAAVAIASSDTFVGSSSSEGFVTSSREGFVTDGPRILSPDGHEFVPLGVNLLGPDSFWPFETAGLSEAMDEWRLNTVRLNTCLPRGCESADGAHTDLNDDLDAIVEEYTSARIVVIIALHQIGPGRLPDNEETVEIAAWWASVAERYGDNPYVWFNLLNEPGHGSPVPARWLTVHQRLIEAVRGRGADNLVVVDGTQWGQEAGTRTTRRVTQRTSAILQYGEDLMRSDERLVFSFHVYDQWSAGPDDAYRQARLGRFIDDVHALGVPVVITETGGPGDRPGGPLAAATRVAYEIASHRGVGVIAWHGQPGDGFALTTNGGFGDIDDAQRPGNLTWHGRLLWSLSHGCGRDPDGIQRRLR